MKRPVRNADFVRIWETAPTATEAGRLAGMSLNAASMRAARLREAGVPLRKFPRGRPKREPIDVAGLKAVVVKVRSRARALLNEPDGA